MVLQKKSGHSTRGGFVSVVVVTNVWTLLSKEVILHRMVSRSRKWCTTFLTPLAPSSGNVLCFSSTYIHQLFSLFIGWLPVYHFSLYEACWTGKDGLPVSLMRVRGQIDTPLL